jgi:hypothetical protein
LASNFPQFGSIKSGLYKNKRRVYPKLPASIEDLVVLDELAFTEEGKRFLLRDIKEDFKELLFSVQIEE